MDGNRPPSLVDRIVRTADGSVRAEEAVLPESWELALSFLRDLRDNERYVWFVCELGRGKVLFRVRNLCAKFFSSQSCYSWRGMSNKLKSNRVSPTSAMIVVYILTTKMNGPTTSKGTMLRRRREMDLFQRTGHALSHMVWNGVSCFCSGRIRSEKETILSQTPRALCKELLSSGVIRSLAAR